MGESLDDEAVGTVTQAPRPARQLLVRLLQLAVSVAILWYLFTRVPLDQVLTTLGRADLYWVATGLLLALLVQWLTALRLKILADLHGLGLSKRQTFEINLATRFYGSFLPGGTFTGVAVRLFKLLQIRRHVAGAVMAISFDRVLATLTMLAVGISCWLAARPSGQWIWLALLSAALLALLLPISVLLLMGTSGLGWLRAKRVGGRLLARPLEAIRLAVDEVRAMTAADGSRVLALSLVAQLVGLLEFVAIARAVELEVGVLTLGWIRSAMLLVALPPVSVADLGLREGAAIATLSDYGIGNETALAFSLLVFATSLAVGLVGGVLEGWRWLSAR
ncbi:MAG TPA: lysylphosphatidylglycerol synthase transmembrane domain-containing protein [Gammaproteobacteria bacterium]|nr:lysylphosphatidylglycerol synthase transmembrane domain-containing protein [Gammaproteobacteria bacterium]